MGLSSGLNLPIMQNNVQIYRLAFRTRQAAFWLCAVLFCGLLLAGDVRAQSGTAAAQLTLTSENEDYSLGPYVYVVRDPGKNMTYTSVIDRHMAGNRGELIKGNILNLGTAGTPHWLIMTINNQTWNDNWILSLGRHLDGRSGLIDKIFIYDHSSRKRLIDTVSPPSVPGGATEEFSGTTVSVPVPHGGSALLVMYVVPRAGMPLTLSFDFMSEKRFVEGSMQPFTPDNLAYIILALVIGLHLTFILLMRMWNNVTFIAYSLIQFSTFVYLNDTLYTPLLGAYNTAVMLSAVAVVLGAWSVKVFFSMTRHDGLSFLLLICVPLTLAFLAVAVAFVFPAGSIFKSITIGFIILLSYIFLGLASWAQGVQGKTGTAYMAAGWLCAAIGIFITTLAGANIIEPTPASMGAHWHMLVLQAFCILLGLFMRSFYADRAEVQKEDERAEENAHVGKLIQVKESNELARLKRLVEHERQVMTELRNREVEQNEEMRKSRITADEANRAKSAFLAVVSHEIRTPMTGIMGMVRLLLDTTLSASQKDYAETIQDSGDAMMALLNDILDFEKIESGKMDLEHIDFDLHRLANSVITLMSGHATNKGIYLRLNMSKDMPRYLVGDPIRVRQVLLNLVGNSIKFTKEGGVTLEILPDPAAETTSRADMHRVRFSVRDTGVGISKEAQRNLFNPFSQADSSVSRKFGGTGLGLAISQRLIEAMGGKIMIDSEEGHGSSFYFSLLMEEGQSVLAEEGRHDESLSRKSAQALRILVVEDNEINQKLLREFIERMGHEVTVASTGEEALDAVRHNSPHLIFMDVELPGISGMGATKAIRAMSIDELAKIPVIALTGNTREEDIRACYAANMNGHIAKPVDPLRLRQMIDKVIQGKLDNPVVLSEERNQVYTQTTQLIDPTAKDKPKPSENQDVAPAEAVAEGVAPVSIPSPAPTPSPNPAPADEYASAADLKVGGDISPLKSYADTLSPENFLETHSQHLALELELDDDELGDDSFALAVDAAAEREGQGVAAAEEQPANNVFDESMLKALKDGMPPDQLKELVDGLLDTADTILAALAEAAAAQDVKAITARAHELKGMAGNFGLTVLSEHAAHLEKGSKAGTMPLDQMASHISALPDVLSESRDAITRWIKL